MRKNDIEYYSNFLDEFQNETDRGAALIGAALIDNQLKDLLLSHLLDTDEASNLIELGYAPLGTFSSRILATYCLGLITDLESKEFNTIRKTRNIFAHSLHGISFDNQQIKDLCNNLITNTPDHARFDGNPRQLYINAIVINSLNLFYRPEYNASNKCKQKKWQYQLIPD
ncbi:hypothetical protein KA005_38780 [bacterium]|nr:hypothetical protein [bacterium]